MPAPCTTLLGPEYALLRPEFTKARKNLKNRVDQIKRVFVFFGASDPSNLTGLTLEVLSEPEFANLEVDVVIGLHNECRTHIEHQIGFCIFVDSIKIPLFEDLRLQEHVF